jgi:hypothetical protein
MRDQRFHLPRRRTAVHAPGMFLVSEADAAAIRSVFEREGELAAGLEVRRLFPGVTDNAKAREWACAIASWRPLPPAPPKRPRA